MHLKPYTKFARMSMEHKATTRVLLKQCFDTLAELKTKKITVEEATTRVKLLKKTINLLKKQVDIEVAEKYSNNENTKTSVQ